MSTQATKASPQRLAVVGIGCRLPGGGDNPASFWLDLLAGRDSISDVPDQRWNHDLFHDSRAGIPAHTQAFQAGFVEGIDQFDPQFFGISPREAQGMDPQHRLLLEVAWEALEDAGLTRERVWGSETGVFVGISTRDYNGIQDLWNLPTHSSTGQAQSIAANRISYCFNLLGPSVAYDTACSSSLVALHAARRSLEEGECEMALVGGVNMLLDPAVFVGFSRLSMLSPQSRCMAFDSRGNGFVRAEGSGVVVLKPLERALQDGDRIYATLLNTGVNQDGRSKGLTFPCVKAQKKLLRSVYSHPDWCEKLVYVEAHGTGTPVGDPVEASALGEELAQQKGEPLLLGSVKTNIGHLEAGAGIAGLIKTCLVLHHRLVPANLHFQSPHPDIPLQALNLQVPVAATKLPDSGPLVAGVNSFGFGGTNAHAVLQTPPEPAVPAIGQPSPESLLLGISAHSDEALSQRRAALCAHWAENAYDTSTLAHNLNVRRTHHPYRWAGLVSEPEHLLQGAGAAPWAGNKRPVFVYSGQGTQWKNMGLELALNEPVFADILQRCGKKLHQLGGWSLQEILKTDLQQTSFAQPAIFSVQAALTELWRSWGVEPAAAVGHSVGEVAAAYATGVLDLEQALEVIFHRGRCMESASPRGSMVAVEATPDQLKLERWPGLSLAAVNGPSSLSVAGEQDALASFCRQLQNEGFSVKPLRVEYAFHSPQMDPVRQPLLQALAHVRPGKARIPLYSSVNGSRCEGADWGAEYWWRNVRQTVEFAPAVKAALKEGFQLFLEVGSHPALAQPLQECMRKEAVEGRVVASLRHNQDQRRSMLASAGRLYQLGLDLRWERFQPQTELVSLPTYPWQKQRYWSEDPLFRRKRLLPESHPLLGQRLSSQRRVWQLFLHPRVAGWTDDHKLRGETILPASAYLEAVMGTREDLEKPLLLEEFSFQKPCFLPQEEPLVVQTSIGDDGCRVELASRPFQKTDDWQVHCTGRVVELPLQEAYCQTPMAIQGRLEAGSDKESFYNRFRLSGLEYGPDFQRVEQTWASSGEALGLIRAENASGFRFHPAALDAALQTILAAIPAEMGDGAAFLPVELRRMAVFAPSTGDFYSHVRIKELNRHRLVADLTLLDEEGRVLARLEGFQCRPSGAWGKDEWLHQLEWLPVPLTGERTVLPACAILSDEKGLGAELHRLLTQAGSKVEIDPERVDGRKLLIDLRAYGESRDEVDTCWRVAAMARGWAGDGPKLILVTGGVQGSDGKGLSGAGLWGLRRVLANERRASEPRIIDLTEQNISIAAQQLFAEITTVSDGEDEILYQRGQRLAARMVPTTFKRLAKEQALEIPSRGEVPVRLECGKEGLFDELHLTAQKRRSLAGDEVRIEVEAAGLNFSDVLKVLGLYPALEPGSVSLGAEASGKVVEVGEEVTRVNTGQRVLTLAAHCFSTEVTAKECDVVPLPSRLSAEDAAAIPIAFLTADYALNFLARLQPGERVLIHSATGGVGLAAIQLARLAGAEIYATAGTQAKRAFLREMGVKWVADSRSLEFVNAVRQWTGGEGVDVILNSLTGPAIRQGLSLLRPFGRFLEIGKRDLYADSALGMAPLRNNISFHAIDLDQMLRTRPPLLRGLLAALMQKFEEGVLSPLPRRDFPLSQATAAFRYLAKAQHIGKVVVTNPPAELAAHKTLDALSVHPDRTYLITGGTSGFGLATAKWLAGKGAGKLLLMGRNRRELPRFSHTEVEFVQGDVGNCEDVVRAVKQAGPALCGVFHAAGVVEDRLLEDVDRESFFRVMRAKTEGACNLHRATRHLGLEAFVLYGSVSAVMGPPGQSAYAAANSFLAGLARMRRQHGLPALVVDWGHIGEVGHAARHPKVGQYLTEQGLPAMNPAKALEEMVSAINFGPELVLARIDWGKVLSRDRHSPRFAELRKLYESNSGTSPGHELLLELMGTPAEKRVGKLLEHLIVVLARVLESEPARIDIDQPLTDVGLDSIMAYELRTWVEDGLQLTLPTAELMKGPSLAELAELLVAQLGIASPAQTRQRRSLIEIMSEDSVLPSALQPGRLAAEGRAILLTGATGFVGSFILRELLRRPDNLIYCLVRATDPEQGLSRVLDSPALRGHRVDTRGLRIVPGDAAQNSFGLSEESYEELRREVGTVFHAAAQVNFLYKYEALRRANVEGTLQVLRFCCGKRSKFLHYLSSIAVYSPEQFQGRVEESDLPTDLEGLVNGYSQTKWVAERLVTQASERGLRCTIYRPGVLVGDRDTGTTNHSDMLLQLFKSGLQLRLGPDLDWKLNLTPVDFAARFMVGVASSAELGGGVYHVCNTRTPGMQRARQWTEEAGFPATLVPYLQWRQVMAESGPEHLLPFLPDTQEGIEARIGLEFPPDKMEAAALKMGLELPCLDQSLWNKYLEYLCRQGILQKSQPLSKAEISLAL